jgi:hypothetical protein
MSRGPRATAFLSAGIALLIVAAPLASHDFWLIPHAFQLAPGDELVVSGQTSSDFPTTLSAVTPDRLASAFLLGAGFEEEIADLGVAETSLRLRHRPERSGQAVVAVTIHARSIPESPESFRRYLTLEGAPEALERYEREGILPADSITRRYAKYAKSLVQIGEAGPAAYDVEAGHPLEFMPLTDPSAAAGGEELRFRMLLFGEPLPHARGHASVAESMISETAYHHAEFETDAEGVFAIDTNHAGIWNVRALYILPAPQDSGADWDVHWATYVWSNGGPGMR